MTQTTKPKRWQDEFSQWLETRPDMKSKGLIEQLSECIRERPDIGEIRNVD
jgi:hypothetical protein